MSLLSRRRGGNGLEIWPGYVDALSTLLMVTIFVLLVFVLAEAFLSAALSGSNKTINALRGDVSQLANTLSLEHSKNMALQTKLTSLRASLANAQTQIVGQEQFNTTELRQVTSLDEQIAALRLQLDGLAAALDASAKKDQAQHVQLVNLGKQLNAALARKVQKLQQYRSAFFGELRHALAGQKDIKIVGDRFVFESAVLFPSDSAKLSPDGQQKIATVAKAINDIAAKIPPGLHWVLSVDGFADQEAITGGPYKDNFDLSTARALAVLHLLIQDGVPKNRVIAAGFGANHPIAQGNSATAMAQNRRIEFRLTSAD